jgi:hypothetical protein
VIKQFFDRLFNRSPLEKTNLMLFDGDQLKKSEFKKFLNGDKSFQYEFVSKTKSYINVIKGMGTDANITLAPSCGKETSDKVIAMKIVQYLMLNNSIKSVYVVSSDADFVDVMEVASHMFPDVNFIQLVDARKNRSSALLKNIRRLQNEGRKCSTILYKMK